MRVGKTALAATVVGFLLMYVPLLAVAVLSFNTTPKGQRWGGFTTAWYVHMVQNQEILAAAWNTLVIAVASTAISTILGTLLAIGLARTPLSKGMKRCTDLLTGLPVVTPDIILGISLVGAFAVLRSITPWFNPGLFTLIIAHTTFEISFVAVVVGARLAMIGNEQIEAARDLYASTTTMWRKILLPQLAPGIVAGALLAFVLSVDDFVVTFFLYAPTSTPLPIMIQGSLRRGVTPDIHALSTVIVAITTLAIVGAALFSRKPSTENP
jgi:spermidine/putrescine transport system permease protein